MLLAVVSGLSADDNAVDFRRDIGPILSDTCFKCHGPDEHDRQADLRLDTKDGLFEDSSAVVPADLDSSELYQRIISDDPDSLMPPPDSGRKLSAKQKELLKRWIDQGAEWENHWSLVPPVEPESPTVKNNAWPANPIDCFIAARLDSESLSTSPPADRLTLIRRVAFDLTGLPPSRELINQYASTQQTDWYERLVDELLSSPHYGEHMARFWLDAARYGDTHGLHLDNYREMWPYRDWVVKAFNRNMSYRDFTIEQLAGDLLENPSDDQLIASGFNRAHITTSEGGAIDEEVYVRNVVDRVSTTGTIFLGMTVGCAQCHDHKFDPISQQEFYQLFAFFNNLTDAPLDKNAKDPAPVMKVVSDDERIQLAELEESSKQAKQKLSELVAEYNYVDRIESESDGHSDVELVSEKPTKFVWIDDDTLPVGAKKEQKWEFVSAEKGPVHTGSNSRLAVSSGGMVQHFFTGAASPLKAQAGDQLFAYVFLDPKDPPQQVMLQFNDGNWEHRVFWGENKIEWGSNKSASRHFGGPLPETGKWVQLKVNAKKVGFSELSLINGFAFTQFGGKAYWDSAGIISKTKQDSEFNSLAKWIEAARKSKGEGLPGDIKAIVKKPEDKLDESAKKMLREHFLTRINPDSRKSLLKEIKNRDEANQALKKLNEKIPTTLISKENEKPKQAFVLLRGEYDQHGDPVERATPAALPEFLDEFPKDRLGFAHWLTTGNHPLTARVAVNRFWQQLFGTGIVKTSEDFGAQGEVPSHPELLDWLATDFVEHDWDVKRQMKIMVMSSTYRQSSVVNPELVAIDPENRLLARGPRFRLDAEMLRDQALAVSGLLVPTIGGPGVKPPQPDGLWFAVGYSGSNTVRFSKDKGSDKVHRRSLYTFWKRTAPPPQMNTFDAPSREECRVRRERTNTPLQALLLMNDPQYIEAARYLAEPAVVWHKNLVSAAELELDRDRLTLEFMFEQALMRPATESELALLKVTLNENRKEFLTDVDAAKELVAIGEMPADLKKYNPEELATWTMIASLIMNMDEFVTKN